LNAQTIKDRTALPHIRELLDIIIEGRIYSKLDADSGFHLVRIHPADRHKTAFRTKYGHFQWNVMPFGLTNAPATFQALMNYLLRDLIDVCVVVYLDDILIFSKNPEDHEKHLQQVMKILNDSGIHLNRAKCTWWQDEVKFLGWIIKNGTIRVDPYRISCIREFPTPKTTTQLRAFLGLVNQILPAVSHLASHLAPMTDLLKGRPRKTASIPWTPESSSAFERVKDICLHPANLSSFDPNLDTYLYTDWSTTGIGGWVGQKSPNAPSETEPHPIAYYSKKLNKSEGNYAAYQGELLALTRCLEHFRQYLIGHPTTLRFDQKALDGILSQKKLSPTQWRQLATILEFDLRVEWIPGHQNHIADILSRLIGQQDADTQTTDTVLNQVNTYLKGVLRERCFSGVASVESRKRRYEKS
jgi:hypothetical protein